MTVTVMPTGGSARWLATVQINKRHFPAPNNQEHPMNHLFPMLAVFLSTTPAQKQAVSEALKPYDPIVLLEGVAYVLVPPTIGLQHELLELWSSHKVQSVLTPAEGSQTHLDGPLSKKVGAMLDAHLKSRAGGSSK